MLDVQGVVEFSFMPNRSGKLVRIETALMLYEFVNFFSLAFLFWGLYILPSPVLGRLTPLLCFVSFVCFHFPGFATHSGLSTQLLSFLASIFLDIISPLSFYTMKQKIC